MTVQSSPKVGNNNGMIKKSRPETPKELSSPKAVENSDLSVKSYEALNKRFNNPNDSTKTPTKNQNKLTISTLMDEVFIIINFYSQTSS